MVARILLTKSDIKYKGTPFRMLTGDGEVVVLPAKYIDELKHLAPSILSSLDAQYEVCVFALDT